jgi:hypothetical protein
MALITDYNTLSTAVGDYLARSDLTGWIPNFIQNAEISLNRMLRLRFMETDLSGQVIAANGTWALPADYIEMGQLFVVDGTYRLPLTRMSVGQLYDKYPNRSSDSRPAYWGRRGNTVHFGPFPDTQYSLEGFYYARPAALSGSNTTNWYITNAPDVLLYGALIDAEQFLKNDDRIATWRGMYQAAIQTLIDEDSAEEASGGPVSEQMA